MTSAAQQKPSLFSRLFGGKSDDYAAVRPLWHALVAAARSREWYAPGGRPGIADTLAGRFDAITLVLSLALLRMEGTEELRLPSVRLTELFVTDMDGQLRESGVGDLVVGKHIGRLMSVLGGRLGAYRAALGGEADLAAALERNLTLAPGADLAALAQGARQLADHLAALDDAALLEGRIAL
ncbi:ubiquinol-cytochrome C chaperone family protein [Novosphingobium humi]|uniref:Ubiquinol-cytochrome C chaperone family protein n=1 Tax=Novosphingobium humi TaxID=2282397 RepID=A0ABY7U0I5_9SPHN|nr:ubiquinol-cytochrome C chaperone family protein [Novosphingobium humi]WCT77574.1 ubiquinol-cytochrome C chaperone family protein [Novosphingobium humi]